MVTDRRNRAALILRSSRVADGLLKGEKLLYSCPIEGGGVNQFRAVATVRRRFSATISGDSNQDLIHPLEEV